MILIISESRFRQLLYEESLKAAQSSAMSIVFSTHVENAALAAITDSPEIKALGGSLDQVGATLAAILAKLGEIINQHTGPKEARIVVHFKADEPDRKITLVLADSEGNVVPLSEGQSIEWTSDDEDAISILDPVGDIATLHIGAPDADDVPTTTVTAKVLNADGSVAFVAALTAVVSVGDIATATLTVEGHEGEV